MGGEGDLHLDHAAGRMTAENGLIRDGSGKMASMFPLRRTSARRRSPTSNLTGGPTQSQLSAATRANEGTGWLRGKG